MSQIKQLEQDENTPDIGDMNEKDFKKTKPKKDDNGVYNFGFIMIAPGAAKVPSQQIKTEFLKVIK